MNLGWVMVLWDWDVRLRGTGDRIRDNRAYRYRLRTALPRCHGTSPYLAMRGSDATPYLPPPYGYAFAKRGIV